jgi:hypothetical protein
MKLEFLEFEDVAIEELQFCSDNRGLLIVVERNLAAARPPQTEEDVSREPACLAD